MRHLQHQPLAQSCPPSSFWPSPASTLPTLPPPQPLPPYPLSLSLHRGTGGRGGGRGVADAGMGQRWSSSFIHHRLANPCRSGHLPGGSGNRAAAMGDTAWVGGGGPGGVARRVKLSANLKTAPAAALNICESVPIPTLVGSTPVASAAGQGYLAPGRDGTVKFLRSERGRAREAELRKP